MWEDLSEGAGEEPLKWEKKVVLGLKAGYCWKEGVCGGNSLTEGRTGR